MRRQRTSNNERRQRQTADAAASPRSEDELDAAMAVHETAAQMLDRMAAALERKNAAARQNLAGGLNQVR